MANDAALRSAIVWVAVIIVCVGIFTLSLKKMIITYGFGMVGIAGILLPDWDHFDRDFSRWSYPVTVEERAALLSRRSGLKRYRIYPMRVIIYTTIYGFGIGELMDLKCIKKLETLLQSGNYSSPSKMNAKEIMTHDPHFQLM
ncbi:hypothetical protein REPUB_Repub19eG0081700 [Reevesia pubescens]